MNASQHLRTGSQLEAHSQRGLAALPVLLRAHGPAPQGPQQLAAPHTDDGLPLAKKDVPATKLAPLLPALQHLAPGVAAGSQPRPPRLRPGPRKRGSLRGKPKNKLMLLTSLFGQTELRQPWPSRPQSGHLPLRHRQEQRTNPLPAVLRPPPGVPTWTMHVKSVTFNMLDPVVLGLADAPLQSQSTP